MDVNAFLEPVPRADRRIPRGSVRFSRPVSGAFTVSGPAPCVDVGRCTVPSAVRYSIISIDAKLSCTHSTATGKLLLNADSIERLIAHNYRLTSRLSSFHARPVVPRAGTSHYMPPPRACS
jgi:hypothetical protein